MSSVSGKRRNGPEDSFPGGIKGKVSFAGGAAAYPFPEWNSWGGDSSRKLKEGTGYFSTFKSEDGRWHLTDPDGCDYFSLGPCGTRAGEWGRIDSFEGCCDWLPREDP